MPSRECKPPLSDQRRSSGIGPALIASAWCSLTVGAATIELEVDATDLPRNLLRSVMSIESAPAGGEMDLFFVIWTPGNHTPSGPIENLVDLVIRDCRGAALEWKRDPERMERFTISTPPGCDRIHAAISYIASQPNANSRSTDTYGRPAFGVLNWNTALLYPGGKSNQRITVSPSLALPSEWAYATSLRSVSNEGERFGTLKRLDPTRAVNIVQFADVPLAELIDSPVIMGRHLRSFPLSFEWEDKATSVPPHAVSVVAGEAEHAEVPGWLLKKIAETCRQSMLLCGGPGRWFPRKHYEFLLVADSSLGGAVEHAESTLTMLGSRVFVDAKEPDENSAKAGGGALTVLPHEYFHVWCGKLAAPEGLVRPDFSTPARTELLWVYEGLTTYYDNVLAARGGMISPAEFRQDLLNLAVTLEQRSGRLWRSVEDTAVAARFLRQRGLYWYDRRRGQEYYGEGALFWAEADAIIRRASDGERSLDDFCRELFNVPVRPVGDQAAYTRGDVVRILTGLDRATDWEALIRARIETPPASLDLSPVLALMGWTIEYAEGPTPEQKKIVEEGDTVNLRTSLGLRLDKNGEIIDIVPGGPADEAGLAYGMKVIAADGLEYSKDRIKDAVKETPKSGAVVLITSFGGRVETIRVPYDGGPRIPRLVRLDDERDWLGETIAPLRLPQP